MVKELTGMQRRPYLPGKCNWCKCYLASKITKLIMYVLTDQDTCNSWNNSYLFRRVVTRTSGETQRQIPTFSRQVSMLILNFGFLISLKTVSSVMAGLDTVQRSSRLNEICNNYLITAMYRRNIWYKQSRHVQVYGSRRCQNWSIGRMVKRPFCCWQVLERGQSCNGLKSPAGQDK